MTALPDSHKAPAFNTLISYNEKWVRLHAEAAEAEANLNHDTVIS